VGLGGEKKKPSVGGNKAGGSLRGISMERTRERQWHSTRKGSAAAIQRKSLSVKEKQLKKSHRDTPKAMKGVPLPSCSGGGNQLKNRGHLRKIGILQRHHFGETPQERRKKTMKRGWGPKRGQRRRVMAGCWWQREIRHDWELVSKTEERSRKTA